jgi:hypothetical protein
MNSFCFCLPWKVFIFPSIKKNSFVGYNTLDELFPSGLWIHYSMPSMLLEFLEKSEFILMGLPLCMTCHLSLVSFKSLSFFLYI